MVPFVAAGGLLIALGFAIGGWQINKAPSVIDHFVWTRPTAGARCCSRSAASPSASSSRSSPATSPTAWRTAPVWSPASSAADRLNINAGFLGGLVAGLLAGGVVIAIRSQVPRRSRGIMPVVVIPLISSAVVGFLMFVVVGKPIAARPRGMTDWLTGLSGANAVLLGVLLGLMMCFDLGGPVNKVAYAFARRRLAAATRPASRSWPP